LISVNCTGDSFNPSSASSKKFGRSCTVWEDKSDYDDTGPLDDYDKDIFGRSYTPGFELIMFIGALVISLIILKKRKQK
jgi:hypothetical protein